ncbi:MAG: hypothetical protein A3B74_00520 [Candidatus Kerfeldbacteria bacterium RIFCSPHIGHO2_02_FULL_42_14]|uniref:Uncharacterized protein n=1 Tax=Candidatus Kerfeldbacteria bacterium RIFCSPHIGHO2_02_FULL_42_14 TaxID=1798540 RepID=A0A1G2AS17_9BACT|nr:MAG: hypothetical protein A3B74_00520 [Candidatus Kerfeldbacteria bacterium RIFCSPHIGHO2_02_FULL_42_14]OGY81244.1 MAG: hypothetical protein A3E60_02215 [Candidatus Kerfeldbacteria bacterium RIFCSPHIGHO2_12_FULL_42_13]OGY83519.1 MAG: hypothetical protein A3I91_02655 [Candidatus Kerfeldbacteria bacterium RIFCSPLOWO2_02_FULL_42_19]OGY85762.1 MAG: hypothetical protein A3G01_03875 [Candidatus Kerfeldbacteria bacterium RIFCSPLOWO2_12_FULL_43_9]
MPNDSENIQKAPSQGGAKKFFSVLFLLLFLFLGPSVLYATLVQRTLLNATGIKSQLRKAQIGERFPQLAADFFAATPSQIPDDTLEGISKNTSFPIQDPFLPFGGRQQFEEKLSQILPPHDVYVFLDNIVDTTFAWWDSGQPLESIPLVLSFSSIKERLKPVVISSLESHINNLPVCTPEELAQMGLQNEGDLPNVFSMACRPEGFTLDNLEQQGISKDQLAQMALISIYDKVDVGLLLSDAAQADPEQFEQFNVLITQMRQAFDTAALVLLFLQIFTGFCFLMILILNFSSLTSLLRYAGWALFLCGLFILAQAGFLYFFPDAMTIATSGTPELEQFADILPEVIHTVFWSIIRPALFVGTPLFLVGIILLIVRHFASSAKPVETKIQA